MTHPYRKPMKKHRSLAPEDPTTVISKLLKLPFLQKRQIHSIEFTAGGYIRLHSAEEILAFESWTGFSAWMETGSQESLKIHTK
jgi:hypothetical protein